MGLFKSRKSESLSIDDLLALKDSEINKALKSGKAPVKTAKELRALAKKDRRAIMGESGFSALRDAAKDRRDVQDTRARNYERRAANGDPHALAEMKQQDPKAYQALVAREYERQKRAGLL